MLCQSQFCIRKWLNNRRGLKFVTKSQNRRKKIKIKIKMLNKSNKIHLNSLLNSQWTLFLNSLLSSRLKCKVNQFLVNLLKICGCSTINLRTRTSSILNTVVNTTQIISIRCQRSIATQIPETSWSSLTSTNSNNKTTKTSSIPSTSSIYNKSITSINLLTIPWTPLLNLPSSNTIILGTLSHKSTIITITTLKTSIFTITTADQITKIKMVIKATENKCI